ncbi:conserved hypothetical protein [Methanosalsum zhilinae DSM 4017]|uniref:Heat-shock protein n=1 Tax=Methanosalsum zhilinae (strain DSM 4017 / NBRC 107636 / OCM 62 / WeN5) TaxID=679901 RepID=F7XPM0_METZD|nr:hypothetical protein [Methanosalsum zhilinae]AEH61454.1 conserved hypothetical protein [Methanosalsum zhilinae DSM 4017]
MNFLSENPFVQAIAASTVMAVFMIGVALGIMFMMSNSISPMPLPLILLIFAVVFITGSVFFENRGADQVGSLVGGFIASVALTFASVSFFGGIRFAAEGGIQAIGWEQIISALAVCMIASMLLIKMLSCKMQEHFA